MAHEIGHALGMWHEQSRFDRDNFVRLVTSNIQSSTIDNFNKLPESQTQIFGLNYDYGSVMHYGDRVKHSHDFSKGKFSSLLGREMEG